MKRAEKNHEQLLAQKRPFKCPVCNGHGIVSTPPWIAGDQKTFASTDTTTYPCGACLGKGIVWTEKEAKR